MGWFGKLTFGSLGMFLGGPLGAIAGAVLGHHLIDKKAGTLDPGFYRDEGPVLRRNEQTQATYFITLFSILGKFAKIDGVVTRDEIKVVESFINGLRISEDERQFAKNIFNEAKNSTYAIEDFAVQLYRATRDQPTILLSFMNLLFQIAAADGKLHPAEEEALIRIKNIFSLSDQQFRDMKAVYFSDLEKYYKILNCSSEDSDQKIKSNYKTLVKDFHPDTLVSKGLPEEFTEFAAGRFREIQDAYENIRRERGMS
jgi:DnaJ like chaperone protein